MFATYLVRGAKAGLVAGLVFGVFLAVVATPVIGVAEHGHDASTDHEPAVSSAVGSVTSVLAGIAWGVLLGTVVFGGVFYLVEPALPAGGGLDRGLVAGAGFVTVSGAPWLVLPPLAPGVERVVSVSAALGWYTGAMVVGAGCCLGSLFVYRRLRTRWKPLAAVCVFLPLAALPVVSPSSLGIVTASPTATAMAGVTAFGQLLTWTSLAIAHAFFSRSETGSSRVTDARVNTAD